MSNPYTGNPAAYTVRTNPTITEPADGDPLNVASANPALSTLADAIAFLMQNANLLKVANVYDGTNPVAKTANANGDLVALARADVGVGGLSDHFMVCAGRGTTFFTGGGIFITKNLDLAGGDFVFSSTGHPARLLVISQVTNTIDYYEWSPIGTTGAVANPTSASTSGSFDFVNGLTSGGAALHYASAAITAAGVGELMGSNVVFRKLYPSTPSSFTMSTVVSDLNCNTPSAGAPTTAGVQIAASTVTAGNASFNRNVTVS